MMSEWGWVWAKQSELRDSGHERLASFMDRISGDTCDNRHEEVDKYATEAIQLAREANEPWVELFLRHWRLQSTILHRQQPKQMVREAVSLIEFSSRPENLNCPQSVCAVQDLTACYRASDGPGYYKERMAVCEETLDKLTPKRGCFNCIGAEYVYALYDNGSYSDALEKLEWLDKQRELSGSNSFEPELELIRSLVLLRLELFDRADKTLKIIERMCSSDSFLLQAKVYKALSSALQGRHKIALRQLPTGDSVDIKSDTHVNWVEVISLCSNAKEELLDPVHFKKCVQYLDKAEFRGAYRQSLHIGAMVARLSMRSASDADATAHALETMKRVQPMLKSDLGAADLINEIADEVSSVAK